MTLIATVDLDDTPIIFADMLITHGGDKEDKKLEIPTVGKLSNLPYGRPKITGLWQKICVISDYLVVAYAGDTLKARTILLSLDKLAKTSKIDGDVLNKFYSQRAPFFGGERRLAMVGFCISRVGDGATLNRFVWNGQVLEDPAFGNIHCAGTGVPLLQEIRNQQLIDPDGFPKLPRKLALVGKVLSVCGHLLAEEQTTFDPVIARATGGAYEIAYFDGKRFVKPSITFMTWRWTVEGSVVHTGDPHFIVKSASLGDVQFLNCVRRLPEKVRELDFWQPDLHVTYPIYRPEAPVPNYPHPSIIGYKSDFTQHQISIYHRSERIGYLSLFEPGSTGASVDCSGDTFRMVYDEAFSAKIAEIALGSHQR